MISVLLYDLVQLLKFLAIKKKSILDFTLSDLDLYQYFRNLGI